jgi:hypothetical protein
MQKIMVGTLAVLMLGVGEYTALAQQKPSRGDIVLAQADQQTGGDPNLPRSGNADGRVGLMWSPYQQGQGVFVQLMPPYDNSGSPSLYLGYTEEGSYIKNQKDAKILIWKFPKGAQKGAITVAYNNIVDIPLDVLEKLDSSTKSLGLLSQVDVLIAKKGAAPGKQPVQVAQQQPKPNTGGGEIGEKGRNGGVADAIRGLGLQNRAGPQGIITGRNAEVTDGVLSFTDSTGTRVTMKVQPGGGSGVWLALSVDGKEGNDRIVNVQPNGNIVALPLDPALKARLQRPQ